MLHTHPEPSHHRPVYRCIMKKSFPTFLPGAKALSESERPDSSEVRVSTTLGLGSQQLQWKREVWALLKKVIYFSKLSPSHVPLLGLSHCGYSRARLSLR